MQDLDPGAFDKPKLDQPPLEFGRGEAVFGTLHANRQDFTGHSDGTRAERYGVFRITSDNLRTFYQFGARYCESFSVARGASLRSVASLHGFADRNDCQLLRHGGLTAVINASGSGSGISAHSGHSMRSGDHSRRRSAQVS
jgi:hypothetical protein